MINFWHKHLLEHSNDKGAAVLRLPAAAKIQTGDRGVYPWADDCKRQVDAMGPRALGHPGWYKKPAQINPERVLEALDELIALVAHEGTASGFQARRKPSTFGQIPPSLIGTFGPMQVNSNTRRHPVEYKCGGDND